MPSVFTYEIQYSGPLPETGDNTLRRKWLVLYRDNVRFWTSSTTLAGTPYDLVQSAINEFKDIYPEVVNLRDRSVNKPLPPGTIKIVGTVLGEKGPLEGASVAILDVNRKPTGRGLITQADGKFLVAYNVTVRFLKITSVGYKETTLSVPTTLTTDTYDFKEIQLEVNQANLREVVLTAQKVEGTTGKALEKFTLNSAKKLANFEAKIDEVFYGGVNKKDINKKKKGIYDILKAINEVDVCNIVNYFLSRVKIGGEKGGILSKYPRLKQQFEELKAFANELSEAITAYSAYTTVTNTPRTPESIANPQRSNKPTNDKYAAREKIANLIDNLKTLQVELISNIPPELANVLPGVNKLRGTLGDITGFLDRYNTAEDIAPSELEKVVKKIQDLGTILNAIGSIDSLQGVVNLLNLQKQIEKLQQILDPTKLIPTIKKILQVARNINQAGLAILKVISFARTIVKLLQTIIRVIRIIIRLFNKLPLPNLFTVHGVTATLESAKNTVDGKAIGLTKILNQISRLLAIVYEFVTFLLEKIQIIIRELQKLLLQLEGCRQLKDNPIVEEIKVTLTALQSTQAQLQAFADNYTKATTADTKTLKIPGFTLSVVEEQVVDEGVRFTRRRAVAYNDNGILVAQGDLTFSTNYRVILEELRLKLSNQGLITEDTALNIDDQTLYTTLNQIFELDTSDLDSLDAAEEEQTENELEIQMEVSNFVDGLKNGKKLKKKVRQKVSNSVKATRDAVKKEGIQATSSAGANKLISGVEKTNPPESVTPKTLSVKERQALELFVKVNSRIRNPLLQKAVKKAKDRLKKDDEARAELAGG